MPLVIKKKKIVKGSTSRPAAKRVAPKTNGKVTTVAKPTASAKKSTSTSRRTPVAPKKRAPSKAAAPKPTATATKKTSTRKREADPTTGFSPGSDSHVVATELMKGGADRTEIINRCRAKLPKESNRGTVKPVANIVAAVLSKMRDSGYTVESTWILLPPTTASKRAATRAKNARLAKQD